MVARRSITIRKERCYPHPPQDLRAGGEGVRGPGGGSAAAAGLELGRRANRPAPPAARADDDYLDAHAEGGRDAARLGAQRRGAHQLALPEYDARRLGGYDEEA